MHDDAASGQRFAEHLRQIVLKGLAPLAHDEILRAVARALEPRHRQHLRQDDLLDHLRQIAVQQVNLRKILRHELEFDGHVERNLETVARREFDRAADAENLRLGRQRRRSFRERKSADGTFPVPVGHRDRRRRVHPLRPLAPQLLLEIQRVGLKLGQRVSRIRQPAAGRNHALVRTGGHGDLVHADLDHIDLIGVAVQVVKPRLEDVRQHTAFARPGELSRRGRPAALRGHHTRVTGRDIDRVGHFDRIPFRIQPVDAGPEHVAPDAFAFAVRRDDFARSELFADLGGHDADLAERDADRRNDLHIVLDRIEEMPPLRQHFAPDALFAAFDEDRSRRRSLAGLRGHHRHVSGGNVEAAEAPQINQIDRQRDESENSHRHHRRLHRRLDRHDFFLRLAHFRPPSAGAAAGNSESGSPKIPPPALLPMIDFTPGMSLAYSMARIYASPPP